MSDEKPEPMCRRTIENTFRLHPDAGTHKGCNPGVEHPQALYCPAEVEAIREEVREFWRLQVTHLKALLDAAQHLLLERARQAEDHGAEIAKLRAALERIAYSCDGLAKETAEAALGKEGV